MSSDKEPTSQQKYRALLLTAVFSGLMLALMVYELFGDTIIDLLM